MESSKHGIPPVLLKFVYLIALDFIFDVTVNIHKVIPDVSEIDALYIYQPYTAYNREVASQ